MKCEGCFCWIEVKRVWHDLCTSVHSLAVQYQDTFSCKDGYCAIFGLNVLSTFCLSICGTVSHIGSSPQHTAHKADLVHICINTGLFILSRTVSENFVSDVRGGPFCSSLMSLRIASFPKESPVGSKSAGNIC